LKMGHNVFLTGPAGSGKTFVLNKYVKHLKQKGTKFGITASTGIAATHIGGVTIHSWSGLGVKDKISEKDLKKILRKGYIRKRFNGNEVLIIDEISMFNSFQFDSLNKICQMFKRNEEPFGGMQIVCSGDFFQLPPIKRNGDERFITESEVWNKMNLKVCYLEEQHRQQNDGLLDFLNHIRRNNPVKARETLNAFDFNKINYPTILTKLYTHNADVDSIYSRVLEKINEEPVVYEMKWSGNKNVVDLLKRGCLAQEKLELKKGAKVMFVKNNFDAGYVNGTLGEVAYFDVDDRLPVVITHDGKTIKAGLAKWTIEEDDKIKAQVDQIPLRLAWAITVHKSQGMNLDSAEIDLSKCFEEGMGYVALSRLRTLNGLKLNGINGMAFAVSEEAVELDEKLKMMSQAVIEELGKQQKVSEKVSEKKFKCQICGRPLRHKGNCLGCNIRNKRKTKL
ncbi:MAG: PIF1 family DEAD/DEAH box helicase, partial [Candidatus Staskawiczbacteria bacterium]|nr:PIF1 family DEAD/DEAH box helicase [Candidatus Staskawiczbacteria bacterium]